MNVYIFALSINNDMKHIQGFNKRIKTQIKHNWVYMSNPDFVPDDRYQYAMIKPRSLGRQMVKAYDKNYPWANIGWSKNKEIHRVFNEYSRKQMVRAYQKKQRNLAEIDKEMREMEQAGYWIDPAGGIHPNHKEDVFYDPAAMYE